MRSFVAGWAGRMLPAAHSVHEPMRSIIGRPSAAPTAFRLKVLRPCLTIVGLLTLAHLPLGGVAHALPEARTPGDGVLVAPHTAVVNVHTVEPGETVRSIAEKYGVSSETILAANALEDPNLLHAGQQVLVPSADGALHTVAPGETLRGIAAAFGVELADLLKTNALGASPDLVPVGTALVVPTGTPVGRRPSPAELASVGQPAPEPITSDSPAPGSGGRPRLDADAPGTYTVREGDTLRSIADAFGLDILSVVEMNGLVDPDVIKPGSALRIAPGDTLEHRVEPGETLGDIAGHYAVEVQAVLAANSLADPDRLVVGTTLLVPVTRFATPPTPPSPAAPPPPSGAAAPALAPAPPPPAAPAPDPAASPAQPAAPVAAASPTPERVITATVTGYALGAGAVGTLTASGGRTHWGTVAADTRLYPFGTRVRIEGFEDMVFVVEDTGSAVRGNVFDVWFPDAASARRLGARTRQVTILPPGGQ